VTPIDAIHAVPNGSQVLPGLLTGGQPDRRQLEALRREGVAMVVDQREAVEPRGYDEAAEATRLGMAYVAAPVGPRTRDDATIDAVRDALRRAEGPVLVHCASGNRIWAALIAHLVLDHGFDQEDAVEVAVRHGLRSPDILQWALDYLARQRG
jgi:uncharacterized protein (TIGR01244 family)